MLTGIYRQEDGDAAEKKGSKENTPSAHAGQHESVTDRHIVFQIRYTTNL